MHSAAAKRPARVLLPTSRLVYGPPAAPRPFQAGAASAPARVTDLRGESESIPSRVASLSRATPGATRRDSIADTDTTSLRLFGAGVVMVDVSRCVGVIICGQPPGGCRVAHPPGVGPGSSRAAS